MVRALGKRLESVFGLVDEAKAHLPLVESLRSSFHRRAKPRLIGRFVGRAIIRKQCAVSHVLPSHRVSEALHRVLEQLLSHVGFAEPGVIASRHLGQFAEHPVCKLRVQQSVVFEVLVVTLEHARPVVRIVKRQGLAICAAFLHLLHHVIHEHFAHLGVGRPRHRCPRWVTQPERRCGPCWHPVSPRRLRLVVVVRPIISRVRIVDG